MSLLRRNRFTWIVPASFLFCCLAMPSFASATTATRVFPASGCIPADGSPTFGRINSIGQWYSVASIGAIPFICPLISDPAVAIPAVSPLTASVTVHGWDNYNPSSSVYVCDQPAGGGSPTCSTVKYAPNAGSWSVTANLPTMTAGDYIYLEVVLGPVIDSAYCTFWGYSLTNQ